MAGDTQAKKQEGIPMMPPPAARRAHENATSSCDRKADIEESQVQQVTSGLQDLQKGRDLFLDSMKLLSREAFFLTMKIGCKRHCLIMQTHKQ